MKRFFILSILFFVAFPALLIAQSTAKVSGYIYDVNGNPIDNVIITVSLSQNGTFTTSNGFYSIMVPTNDTFQLQFHHLAFSDTIYSLNIQQNIQLDIVLYSIGEQLSQVNVVARHDDGYMRVDPKLSFKMPSPTGGVESLLKTFQGVSSTNELSSQYNVRGGNYDENLVYVNGIQIYRPFLVRSGNQEGLSFVNLDLTNSVKFSAGGFSAEYGDKMSSVMDVEYKRPKAFGSSFSLGLLGGTVSVQGVVKNKEKNRDAFTYLIGMRYKSNAYLLKFMDTKGTYKPRFFDTQMLLTWNVTPKLEISFLGNFTVNKYLYVPTMRETRFGSLNESKKFTIYFDGQEVDKYASALGGLTFSYFVSQRSTIKLILSSYFAKESETYDLQSQYWLSDTEADLGSDEEDIAQEVSVRAVGTTLEHVRNNLLALISAADLRGIHKFREHSFLWSAKVQNEIVNDQIKEWTRIDSTGYTLPVISQLPGQVVPFDDPSRILDFGDFYYLSSRNSLNTVRLSGFLQDIWRIGGDSAQWILNSGIRYHYWSYNNEFTVSPRFNLLFKPKSMPDWTFCLKTGVYYQSPFYHELRDPKGVLNPNIRSQYSYQILMSLDYNFLMWKRPFRLSSEVYYKYMDDVISYSVDNLRIMYSGKNDARGYATGIDMKLSGEFVSGLESWVTLSLMKTAEDLKEDYYYDNEGRLVEPRYIRRPTDQRFAINIFFQDHIPKYKPLRVHLNFVFSSGLPFGAPNTERYKQILTMPWYRRVDVGFSYLFLEQNRDIYKHKSQFIRKIKSAGIYLEIFNILGISNVSSYTWVPDLDNVMHAVPDYLTPRLINLKLAVEF